MRWMVLVLGERKREAAATIARLRQRLFAEWQRRRPAGSHSRPLLGTGPFQACPVDDGTYGDSFGIPSMRSGYHIHQGVDVFARYGSPVRAPFAGRAVVATNPIGGIAVKVFGAAGYVYNAHLSALGALGPVRPGTIIGYVGDTGNARGTSPHDHFEWHPGDGPAVDPYSLLNEAC